MRHTLTIETGAVRATVGDGVITLNGRTVRKTTALAAVELTEAVPGVTGVVDRLTFDVDDTVRAPVPRPPVHDPLRGWWIGPRQDDRVTAAAAGAVDNDHSLSGVPGTSHQVGGATVISQPVAVAATTSPLRHAAAGVEPVRLTPDVPVQPPQAGAGVAGLCGDIVDEWGRQSFPASDPPANW